jgi:hypothetical protein
LGGLSAARTVDTTQTRAAIAVSSLLMGKPV